MKSYYINFRVSRYGMGEDQRMHIKHREIYIVVKINMKSVRCQDTKNRVET
jgi:hypothetical protein